MFGAPDAQLVTLVTRVGVGVGVGVGLDEVDEATVLRALGSGKHRVHATGSRCETGRNTILFATLPSTGRVRSGGWGEVPPQPREPGKKEKHHGDGDAERGRPCDLGCGGTWVRG